MVSGNALNPTRTKLSATRISARLTARGDAVIRKAFEVNVARFRAVFAFLSSSELTRLMALLHRVREAFDA